MLPNSIDMQPDVPNSRKRFMWHIALVATSLSELSALRVSTAKLSLVL